MTLTLPPDLADLVARAGGRFPQADEDRLRDLSASWRSLSGELAVMKDRGSAIAGQVMSSQHSVAIDKFGEQWGEFERQFDAAIGAAEACAAGTDSMARAVLATKRAIAEAAEVVYRKILELRRLADLSGGIACGVARAIIWLLRTFGKQILRFLGSLLKLIWQGIVWLFKKAWAAILAVINWFKRLFKGKPKEPPPVKRQPQPRDRQPPSGSKWDVGSSRLPNLHGRNLADAERELARQGFTARPPTSGGYRRYDHPDGSTVWIRPDGEVIRLGPKIDPGPNQKNYSPRYDQNGGITENHKTGEMVIP